MEEDQGHEELRVGVLCIHLSKMKFYKINFFLNCMISLILKSELTNRLTHLTGQFDPIQFDPLSLEPKIGSYKASISG